MAKKSLLASLRDSLFTPAPPLLTADLSGRTVVVVGANTGIGFEAAKHFAGMSPGKVVIGCRSDEKGRGAVERIKKETGFQNVELRLIDLAVFSSVIAFADSFKDEERLDILVMNAAVARRDTREVTVDGWEEGLQVNALSPSLATLLLLPKLHHTAITHRVQPRIVNVSSDLHYWATLDDAVFDAESAFRALSDDTDPAKIRSRYADTKLLNVFFTLTLSSLLPPPILTCAVNPGYCTSHLRRHTTGLFYVLGKVMDAVMARTSEEGGRQVVWGAVGDLGLGGGSPGGNEGEEHDFESGLTGRGNRGRGMYVNLSKVVEPSDFVLGVEGRRRGDKLWSDLIRELCKIDGRVEGIVRGYGSRSEDPSS